MQLTIKQPVWLAFYLLICGLGAACSPQLGPKEGSHLPPNDLNRVKVDDLAPDFTLEDVNGTPVTLSSLGEKRFVVLVFYRGHW